MANSYQTARLACRKRENEKNQSLYGSNYNNNKSWPKVIADITSDIISYDSNHQ